LIEFRTFQHKELSIKQRVATVLLWMFTIGLPTAAPAQHGDHGAMSPDQIGTASVTFETSCAPAVKDDFNKAGSPSLPPTHIGRHALRAPEILSAL
jgi:hypothetical protein